MELKPGYKLTEIGVIPEDWEVFSLSKCCSKITDGTHDTPQPVRFGVPYLTAIHIKKNHIDFENCYFLPESVHAEIFKRCNPEKGDVLMVNIGAGVATTAWVNVEYEFSLKNVALLKPNIQKLLGKYLNQSQLYRRETIAQSLLSGGAQPFLSLGQIGKIKIPLPPLSEQRSIASALSDMDELLGACDRLIAKKRDLKQAAMQQLLTGKTRLPGFAQRTDYKETEVGLIPEDWLTLKIGDLFSFKNGLNKSKEFFGKGTPIINYMDVFENPGLYEANILGKVSVSTDEMRAYAVRKGDVFFTRTSETVEEIGITTVLLEDIENGVFSGFVLRARPKNPDLDLNLLFKKYCFNSAVIRKQITSTSSYTTRALTNGRLLSQVMLPCPSNLKEQRAIATVLSDMDAEIAALEQRRGKTRALKQAMMQELLTGRIRLV